MRPMRVWGAVALLAVGALGGWLVLRSGGAEELPIYWQVPEFTLVDQRADTLHASDLEGTIWVTSFIFTSPRGAGHSRHGPAVPLLGGVGPRMSAHDR